MRIVLIGLLLVGCWREAPPCDTAGYDAVADTCDRDDLTVADCAARLRDHTAQCKRRIEAE